jgi:hypothetical protein
LRPCVVRISKLASVDARLTGRIGTLASADRQSVAANLRGVLKPVLEL